MDDPIASPVTHRQLRKPYQRKGHFHRPVWSVMEIAGHVYAARECESSQDAEKFIRGQQEQKPAYAMEP